jgi:transcription elongation factor S-II
MRQIQNPQQFRENICAKLAIKLAPIFYCEQNDEQLIRTYTNLEKGIYNYTIKEAKSRKMIRKWDNPHFAQLYIDRIRTIFANLTPHILEQIKTGELAPEVFAFMTHQEMNPEHWRELIDRKIKRDESKLTTNIQASTDMFTCKKCRSKKCTYYELQTRSADEPATIFITCLDCGKHWKN